MCICFTRARRTFELTGESYQDARMSSDVQRKPHLTAPRVRCSTNHRNRCSNVTYAA